MAIINSLAIGKASGSAGNLTFSTIEGRTIARARVTQVRNPNTAAQSQQRGLMSVVVRAYREAGYLTNKTFTVRKKYTSAYNAFVSRNLLSGSKIHYDAEFDVIDYSAGLVMGSGSIPNDSISLVQDDDNSAAYSIISPVLLASLKVGDKIGFYGWSDSRGSWSDAFITLGADDITTLRSGEKVAFDLTNNKVHLVAPYYVSADGRKSNSPISENMSL